MADSKYDDESESDNDYKEVIVNDGDFRAEIYDFPVHRDLSIIKSIGQMKSEFNYQTEHEYKASVAGTGTVYKVADNIAFVVSCAHNIRLQIYECSKCNKYYRKKWCSKCKQTLASSDKKLLKPTLIEFQRRKITKSDFGIVEHEYTCREIYIPPGYEQNTFLQKGFDFAVLMFRDDDNYYSKCCKHIQLKIGTEVLKSHKRWCIFGYPGKDYGNAKKNELYGYAMKTDAQKTDFELKECDKPNGNFDNPTQFVLRQRRIDASTGQSGSSVFVVTGKSNVIVFGVHVGGHTLDKQIENDYAYNVATLLSEEYVEILNNVTHLYTQYIMIHKLREELIMKDKEIIEKVDVLTQKIEKKDNEIVQMENDFKNQNEKLSKQIQENVNELSKKDKKINELSKQVQKNGNELLTKETQINKLSVKITYQIAQQINDLNEKIKKKDNEVNIMSTKMDDLKIEMEEKDKQMKQNLNELSNDLRNALNKNEKQMNYLVNLMDKINNTLEIKDKQITNLENKFNLQNEEKKQIESIKKLIYNKSNLLELAYEIKHNTNEEWDEYTLADEFSINGNKVSGASGCSYPCAFGIQTVKSGITIWRFRIEKGGYWYIGIINTQKVKKMSDFPGKIADSYSCTGDGYSYHQKKRISKHKGLRFKSGDILCMCFNMNNRQLLYSLNNRTFKTMFGNINTSIKYKMAICTGGYNHSIILESCIHID